MLVGVIRSDLGFLAAGVSLLLGGIVAWGSNSRTAKEVTKALAVAEKTLIHVVPPTWPMIQLLGNGRGQYGSTRNAGLWALAEKAAKSN
jgi:hypothetical protein